MNTLDNTTTTVLIVCTTITTIAFLWAAIWAIAWFAANQWRHYYRGLQKQIRQEGAVLLEHLRETDSMTAEAKWIKVMLSYVAENRQLPTQEEREKRLEWFKDQDTESI